MKEAYIVSACRTPIGRFLGGLRSLSAVDLGKAAVGEAIRRAGIPTDSVEEVIMGNVLAAGLGQNPARQTALGSGIPVQVAAFTVNKVCGSGLKAIMLARQSIQTAEHEVVVAGGMESMTNAPFLLTKLRNGHRMGHAPLLDSMISDGLWDAYNDYHMGCTAEAIVEKYTISRRQQDEYALESHARALAAGKGGRFRSEMVPLTVSQGGHESRDVEADEGPRSEISVESLSSLKSAFREDGSVTAGNASQISDGAAAVVVLSENGLKHTNVEPLARIVASATSGVDPSLVMMAPVEAIDKVLKRAGWDREEVDLWEINEAFAAQSVALIQQIPLDPARLNVHGGALALGHPIGASGSRIMTTLLHALREHGLKKGVASLCLGGGNAVAMAVEMV